ncbi:hypothetical protein DQ393_21490 [Rhizobium tropici]|uniref:Uncharacterized protein n=1 Tax=Rhizobium tropici TaxID=398 RepID=A0A329Y9G4_RHITR|nr:hypothetical protein DQ393_21490 [Rhizobium tropici]
MEVFRSAYCLLPTAYCLLPVAYCLPPPHLRRLCPLSPARVPAASAGGLRIAGWGVTESG